MNFDTSVLQVAIEDIIPNRAQPRLAFDDDSLKDLANSIKQHGIIQPLVLRRIGSKYEIVAGERRYRAAIIAGLISVPAVISKIDAKTSAEVALAENVQRKNLTAIEEAKSYQALLDQGLMSQAELSKRLGLSQSAIESKLRLLNLSKEVQDAILGGEISERHGKALLAIDSYEEQNEWLSRIINERIPVRKLDELISQSHPNSSNTSINVEQIKQSSTDIDLESQSSPNIDLGNNQFTMGPISVGDQPHGKFFNVNNLESQSANMQMTEVVSPFSQAGSFNVEEFKSEEPSVNSDFDLPKLNDVMQLASIPPVEEQSEFMADYNISAPIEPVEFKTESIGSDIDEDKNGLLNTEEQVTEDIDMLDIDEINASTYDGGNNPEQISQLKEIAKKLNSELKIIDTGDKLTYILTTTK